MRTKNIFSVLLFSSLLAYAPAQEANNSHISVLVTDVSGARVPHAQVRLTQAATVDMHMETDEKGELDFDLRPGSYELSAGRRGFKEFKINIEAPAAKRQTIPIVLQTGQFVDGVFMNTSPTTLELRFPFRNPVPLRAPDLQVRPHITVTVHNSHTNVDENYSGVRLSDLLKDYGAPLGDQLRGKALATYLIATGSDNYRAVFSLAEIDPSFHPGDVIIADAMNGKALDEKTGPFRLVSTEDKRPARWVHNLVSIELQVAE
jgi:hypothetical protein